MNGYDILDAYDKKRRQSRETSQTENEQTATRGEELLNEYDRQLRKQAVARTSGKMQTYLKQWYNDSKGVSGAYSDWQKKGGAGQSDKDTDSAYTTAADRQEDLLTQADWLKTRLKRDADVYGQDEVDKIIRGIDGILAQNTAALDAFRDNKQNASAYRETKESAKTQGLEVADPYTFYWNKKNGNKAMEQWDSYADYLGAVQENTFQKGAYSLAKSKTQEQLENALSHAEDTFRENVRQEGKLMQDIAAIKADPYADKSKVSTLEKQLEQVKSAIEQARSDKKTISQSMEYRKSIDIDNTRTKSATQAIEKAFAPVTNEDVDAAKAALEDAKKRAASRNAQESIQAQKEIPTLQEEYSRLYNAYEDYKAEGDSERQKMLALSDEDKAAYAYSKDSPMFQADMDYLGRSGWGAGKQVGYLVQKGYSWQDIETMAQQMSAQSGDRYQNKNELLAYVNQTNASDAKAEMMQELYGDSFLAKAAGTVASVPLNLVGGVVAFGEDTANQLLGDGLDTGHSVGHFLLDVGDTARGGVSAGIDNNFGRFIYDSMMSTVDSAAAISVGAATGMPDLTLAIMGSGSAARAIQEGKDRGLSDEAAYTTGLLAGMAEVAFEKISLENLSEVKKLLDSPASTVEAKIKKALTQMGVEGSEEVFTDLANAISDQIVNGNQSALMQSIDDSMAQGMTESEAIGQAMKDFAAQIGTSFLGGAFSGGVFSAGANVISRVQRRGVTKAQGAILNYSGMAPAAAQFTLEYVPENSRAYEQAQKILEKANNGGQLLPRETGNMFRSGVEAYATQQSGELAGVLAENGFRQTDAKEIADRLMNGEELSISQADRVRRSDGARAAVEQVMGIEIDRNADAADVATALQQAADTAFSLDNLIGRYYDTAQLGADAANSGVSTAAGKAGAIGADAAQTGTQSDTGGGLLLSDGYEATIWSTGEPVTVTGIAEMTDGGMVMALSDGTTMPLADLEIADTGLSAMLSAAQAYAKTTKQARAFVSGYNGTMPVEQYQTGFEYARSRAAGGVDAAQVAQELGVRAQQMGTRAVQNAVAVGMNEKSAAEKGDATIQNDSTRNTTMEEDKAWMREETERVTSGQTAQEIQQEKEKTSGSALQEDVKAAKKVAAKAPEKTSARHQYVPVDADTRQQLQEAGVNGRAINKIDKLAKALNRQVILYYEEGTTVNGYEKDGVLYINMARKASRYYTVLGHEMTHSLERSKLYGSLQSYLLGSELLTDWLKKNGFADLEEAVQDRIALYKENGHTLSETGAKRDIVADLCGEYLVQGRYDNAMKLRVYSSRLFTAVRNFVESVYTKLVNRFGHGDAMTKQLLETRDLYRRVMLDAEKAEKQEKSNGEVKHSIDPPTNKKITANMSDRERADILSEKVIYAPTYSGQADAAIAAKRSDLESATDKLVKKALVTIYDQFNIPQTLLNDDMDLQITVSKGMVKESANKVLKDPNQLAKLLPVLEQAVCGAVGIEIHTNRYYGDAQTIDFVELLGGYTEGKYFVPVRFGVRRSIANGNTLYVIVDANKMEAKVVKSSSATELRKDDSRSASAISISKVIQNVNNENVGLLKYLPDAMLTSEQRKGKREGVRQTEAYTAKKNDDKYKNFVGDGNERNAKAMLRRLATDRGYTADADWRMDHKAPNSADDTAHRIDQIDGAYGGDGSIYSTRAAYYYGDGRSYDGKTVRILQSLRNKPDATVTIYRAVPTNIRDTSVRNGDWVAITKEYAQEHGERMFDDGFRIIENKVPARYLYGNGDSIHEYGYDNGQNEVYKNTKNNVKSADITYDDDGNLVPFSKRYDEKNPDIRYSISRAQDSDMVGRAEALEKQGKSRGSIWQETGLLRDAAGQWVYEIDDSHMKIYPNGDAPGGKPGTLSQFVQHETLFNRYPGLMKVGFDFNLTGNNAAAVFNPETWHISMHEDLAKEINRGRLGETVVHELQHVMQELDERAGGSSPQQWAQRDIAKRKRAILAELPDDVREEWIAYEELGNHIQEVQDSEAFQNDEKEALDEYFRLTDQEDRLMERFRDDPMTKELFYLERDWQQDYDHYYAQYMNTAGEIEAREVASRQGLTAAQRRQKTPDLGWDRAVFMEDGGESYSIGYTTENQPVAIIDEDILDGVPKSDWVKTVKRIMTERFANGIPVSGRLIKVNATSRNEMTQSKNSQWYNTHNGKAYKDKFTATGNLDEIVLASTNYVNEHLHHMRKDSFREFARGDVLLRIGGTDYSAKVIIGFTKSHAMVLYDVIDFTPTSFNMKAGVRSSVTQMQSLARTDSNTPANDSITKSGDTVNISVSKKKAQYSLSAKEQMDAMVEEYGAIPKGEHPKAEVQVPQQTSENRKVRRFVRTVLESGHLNAEMVEDVNKAIVKEALSYVPTTNEQVVQRAKDKLSAYGTERAMGSFLSDMENKAPTEDSFALGEVLLYTAAKHEDAKTVMELVATLAEAGTRTGRALQSMRMLKKMPGLGQLLYVQRVVDRLNQDIEVKNRGVSEEKRVTPIEIDENLATDLAEAKTTEESEHIADMLLWDIAEQTKKATWVDKWNEWRYMAMLANPRTHIRNFIGNALFLPAVRLKDAIAIPLERVLVQRYGGQMSKAYRIDEAYKEYARRNFDDPETQKLLRGGGKYNPENVIQARRQVFNTGALETLRRKNSDWLEREDTLFLKRHYIHAMAGYLQANGIDIDALAQDRSQMTAQQRRTIAAAEEYAAQEARKATYRDASEIANWIYDLSKKNTFAKIMVEGVIPFKKTPINILKRGVEYSPAGLLYSLATGFKKVRSGQITAAAFVDGIASGLSGTIVMALGMLLQSMGVLRGGWGDDEKENAFEALQGVQPYALELGGVSYTIDWAAPMTMPLFMGAELMKVLNGEYENATVGDVTQVFFGVAEPMFDMSMLDGLNNMLEHISHAEGGNKLTAIAEEATTSYFSQAVPTIFGQIARTVDDTRRTTYVDKNSPLNKNTQYFLQKIRNKIPVVSLFSEPYVDEWGREEVEGNVLVRAFQNFISPSYISKLESDDAVTQELQRLYDATGESKVFPKKMDKYIKIDGERVDLSAEEYTALSKKCGSAAYQMLSSIIGSAEYAQMSDEDKLAVIQDVYSLAGAVAKEAVSEYQASGWTGSAIDMNQETGVAMEDYVIRRGTQRAGKEQDDEQESSSTSRFRKSDMWMALEGDDADSVAVIVDSFVQDAADSKEKKKIISSIKSSLTAHYKPLYQQAYLDGDQARMQEIKLLLDKAVLRKYGIRYSFKDHYQKWQQEAKEK